MKKIIISLDEVRGNLFTDAIINSPYLKGILDAYLEERPYSIKDSLIFPKGKTQDGIEFLEHVYFKDPDTLVYLHSLSEQQTSALLSQVDDLYDFWRSKERYLVFVKDGKKVSHRLFVIFFQKLADEIVSFYRDIYETILGKEQTLYRVIPSGCNAGILLEKESPALTSSLSFLSEIPLMESDVTQPPFYIQTRQNTRKGFFYEKEEKVTAENFPVDDAYGVLIHVNDTIGLVYFQKDYLGFLVAIGNLFQVESYHPRIHKKIDFVVLFGTEDTGKDCYYYKEEETYVGVCPKAGEIDYFGYAKKIVLTLFNLIMMERKRLPIHGAGVRIRKGDKSRNFFLLGDSGAGKSESLEAIKRLYQGQYQIDTIFDDMGTFHLDENGVYATGSEIGAFVRLDDLDRSYSLMSVDRAVFLNIDGINSRVVVPIEDFDTTIYHHHVDAFLLADNFTDSKEGIRLYSDSKEALTDFSKGERRAMGTTSESGLVSTYFANPFGPMQKKEEVSSYLPDYFENLFEHHIPVGRIYTRLSLDRKHGPEAGAKALIDLFEKA